MNIISASTHMVKAQEAIVNTLSSGGLVVAPSDTVYGLLVDATNEQAVRKLLAFKNRPIGKPISVFVHSMKELQNIAEVSVSQGKTLEALLPGPFTVVLPSKGKVSPLLESERHTIGVRIPQYDFLIKAVSLFGRPVTATSANISGKKPHHNVHNLIAQLSEVKKNLIDLVVDAGTLPRNKPSTVVDLTGSEIVLLRKGDVRVSSSESFSSSSDKETRSIASYLVKKYSDEYKEDARPVVFFLRGAMGVGKTVFAQGAASVFGVSDVISPTYVIMYEYETKASIPYNKFIHYDLYNLQEINEFEHIGLAESMNGKNVIVIEWAEKSAPVIDIVRKKAHIVSIEITQKSESERVITVGTIS